MTNQYSDSKGRSRFFSNTVALVANTIVATLITLIQIKILANFLSKESFGMFVALRGLSVLIATLAANGLPSLLVRFLPVYESRRQRGRAIRLGSGSLTAAALFLVLLGFIVHRFQPFFFSFLHPTAVIGGLSFQHVSAGGYHSCGLATNGAVHCWGYNYLGQLGDGTTTGGPDYGKASPVAVVDDHEFQSVSAGHFHSCGATTANNAYCWGQNLYGQLGDGTYPDRSSPVFVLDLDPPTP